MNLTELFEKQKELDAKIVTEKGLEGQDLLPQKILALQVELGECVNEWRGFKFWSKNQQPRTEKIVHDGHGGIIAYSNPLLEEYIDCLHFILSIGLEIGFDPEEAKYLNEHNVQLFKSAAGITRQFNDLFTSITGTLLNKLIGDSDYDDYEDLILQFIGLGEMLGFTWEQICEAYMEKNKTNHERQANGY